MKKNIIRLISMLLILCCVTSAFAEEEFTLRSGIKFGDTLEEIVKKETSLKQKEKDRNWFKGTIAGNKDSEAGFFFDDSGKLTDMVYVFDQFGKDYKSSEDVSNVYATLYRSIENKYGSPIGNTGGSLELITGKAISRSAFYIALSKSFDGCDGDYIDYDEWTVDCSGGHVKIDLMSFYYRNQKYEYTFEVDLSYHFYTDAEYEEALNEKIAERRAIDDDI